MAIRALLSKFLLCLFVVSCFANKGICSTKEDTAEAASKVAQTHHIIKISSLLSSNKCSLATQAADHREASLQLVHKHGPCSPLKGVNRNTKSDSNLKTLLEQDQTRVNWIRSRLHSRGKKGGAGHQQLRGLQTDAVVPAYSGDAMGTGDYIVTVGVGTPKKQLSLLFDTGSALTWTQCQPCIRHCYTQKEPIFQPSQSSSYANVSCDSDLCAQLDSTTGLSGCITSTSTCAYGIKYGDGSYSVGYLSEETLTITPYDIFHGFVLGCGQNNRGTYGRTAGLLGLSRDPLSIVAQTSSRYSQCFSYCIPSSSSSTGFLAFGYKNPSKPRPRGDVRYTPLSELTEGTQFYGIDMTGIRVAGTILPIPRSVFDSAGTIIDSGTVITRLPPGAYAVMRNAIRRVMSGYPVVRGSSALGMCYDFSGYDEVRVPRISFFFSGGVEVESDVTGILLPVSETQACFAFIGNSDGDSVGIFGNMQQKTWEVVHDNDGSGRVGFGASACS